MLKKLFAGILLLSLAQGAFAIDLGAAKAQGLIGEGNRGYLAYVVKPPSADVMALVKGVNNKRRAKFVSSAQRNKLEVGQVANRFYERAVAATKKGNFYQDQQGSWLRK